MTEKEHPEDVNLAINHAFVGKATASGADAACTVVQTQEGGHHLFITLEVEGLVQNAHGFEILGPGVLQLAGLESCVALLLESLRSHQLLRS